MCFVLLWWALCWLISMHAWLSWKVAVVASNNFLQYVPQQQPCFLKPKQVTCIQFSQSWVKVSVVICLPNWSTCHQRKKEILRCLSPRILILNPIYVTAATKPRLNFPRIQRKVNPIWTFPFQSQIILLITVHCSFSGLEQNLATMLTATAISKHVPCTRCNKQSTPLCMENFTLPSSPVVIVVSNPWTVNSRLSKKCELCKICHRKTLTNLLRLENRQSSSIFTLIHVYIFHIHLSRIPFLMWDRFEMFVLNAWTMYLSSAKVKSSTWTAKMSTVLWLSWKK